jgi:MoaD family protein
MRIKVRAYLKFRAVLGESLWLDVDLEKARLNDVLKELSNRYGKKFSDLLFEPQSADVKRANLVLLNGQSYMNLKEGLRTELKEEDEISLMPALAGG